jgi:heptosyltransferase-2
MEAGVSDSPLPARVASLLVVCPSWVGDTVMATPVLRALREHRPGARIIALARPGLEELLEGAPWIDDVMVVGKSGLTGLMAGARAIRSAKPQVVLVLPNSFRSALTVRLAGVPVRIGYGRDGRSWLLTTAISPPKQRPIPAVEYYAHLAESALGVEGISRRMDLFITPGQREAASGVLRDVPRPFVALNPGANRADKRWPAERFAAVAAALHERHGLAIAVTGSPTERDVIAAVMRAARSPIIDLAARGMTLGSLKAVLAEASLLITNDTGPRHIAAALGTPTVVLFGPTDHRWTTINAPRERMVAAEPFLPEELVADDHPHLCSIARIPVADVLASAETLLGAPSATAGAAR